MRWRNRIIVATVGLAMLACKNGAGTDPAALNSAGMAFMAKGELDSAIARYDEAIRLQPDFPAALWNRGVAHNRKRDYDRAIEDYDRAIALKPDMAAAFNSRGFARQLKGEYEAALTDYATAIQLRPDRGASFINRGRDEFYMGRFAEAATDLRKGLTFDSANVYTAIWAHMASRRSGVDDSAAFATAIARLPAPRWPAHIAKFFLRELTAEQLMSAAADADSAAQNDQRCAAAFYIGESQLWVGQLPEARENFLATVARCPTWASEYHGATTELARMKPPRP